MVTALGLAVLLVLTGVGWAVSVADDVFERRFHDARWGSRGRPR
jgi:hypothetical protein